MITKGCLILILLTLLLHGMASAKVSQKDTVNRSILNIDLAASYYTLFDKRFQFRIGAELQRNLKHNDFIAIGLDAGLFDKYRYVKYYDFLNATEFNYIEQKVSIYGFHVQPGYNKYLIRSKYRSQRGIFLGVLLDASFYRKHYSVYTSKQNTEIKSAYQQYRADIGASGGIKYALGSGFSFEAKTTLLRKLINFNTQNGIPIKILNAQWTDTKNNFGWLTNFKIGYAL